MNKAVYGSVVLSAGGVETLSGLVINGQQVNDELQFYRAAAISLVPRGNRSTPISFSVARQFESNRAASRFVHAHFNELAEQAPLYLRLGTDADGEWVRYDGAVIDSVNYQQLGVSVTVYYQFRAAAPSFESTAPDVTEPDDIMKATQTDLPNGDTEVAVVFATPFSATPKLTGLFLVVPDGGDYLGQPVLVKDSLTASGFTARVPAAANAVGYQIGWSAIP